MHDRYHTGVGSVRETRVASFAPKLLGISVSSPRIGLNFAAFPAKTPLRKTAPIVTAAIAEVGQPFHVADPPAED
jgi:hypothetical protein